MVETAESVVEQRGHRGDVLLNGVHSERLQGVQADSDARNRLEIDGSVLELAGRPALGLTIHSISTWNLLKRVSSLARDTVPPPQYTLSSTPTTALRTNNAPIPVGNPNIL